MIMTKIQTFFTLSLFILAIMGCGTTEDPAPDITEVEMLSGTIQGEVRPIDGVSIQVRLLKAGELVTQTETDGSFELGDLDAGDYIIQISAKGFETIELNVTVAEGQNVPLDKVTLVELADSVSHLRGVLTDSQSGAPLTDVHVKLMDNSGKEYETITSKDGVYTFENLPVGQAFTLTITYAGYEENTVNVKPIPADETSELDIELTPIPEPEVLPPGEGLSIGSQAPAFALPDGNGKQHELSDYIGDKNVVIVFYRGQW